MISVKTTIEREGLTLFKVTKVKFLFITILTKREQVK